MSEKQRPNANDFRPATEGWARRQESTMSTKIIISYDGTANEDDAIALGRVFAGGGAEVALAYVRHSQEPDLDREKLAQGEAEELLARGAALFGNADIARHVVTDRSTPQGLSALALGERAQALGGRTVGDDVAGDVGVAEQGRAAREQLLGLALGELLAVEVGLLGVADVGERHLGAATGEHATEGDRVVLVCGAVVRDDDLGGHGALLSSGPAFGRWAEVVCVWSLLLAHSGMVLPSAPMIFFISIIRC